jgi:hypothetical protein
MTTAIINGKETSAKEFAYDGCHKIYLLESERDKEDARDSEYDILPISKLKRTFDSSCGLQFIDNWSLNRCFISQFEEKADIKILV